MAESNKYGVDTKVWANKSSTAGASKKKATKQSPQRKATPAKEKQKPEFQIISAEIIIPKDGLKQDKPFEFKGEIKPSGAKITRPKLSVKIVTVYKNAKDITHPAIEVSVDTKTHTFKGSCKSCTFHNDFLQDKNKAKNATFDMYLVVSGNAADKEFQSPSVKLPMATQTTILKKGCYDDTWINSKKSKVDEQKYPQSSQNYVHDNAVKKLQENLISFRILGEKLNTGYFGDNTEEAIKKFQEYALKAERIVRGKGKVFSLKTSEITYKGSKTDIGIAEQKTQDEIAIWVQKNYVLPVPDVRKGDVDDIGVQNGKGTKGADNYHEKSIVTDLQKLLTNVGAYKGKIDGWFGEKMEETVKLFQDAASKGEMRDKNNNKVVIDEKERLKEYTKGTACGKTVEAGRKMEEKGLKVYEDYSSYVTFTTNLGPDRQKLLSKKSKNILGGTAKRVGCSSITITSTIRYPNQQADVMYTNLSNGKRLGYAAPGMAVTAEYDDCIKKRYNKSVTIQKMVDKINALSKEGKRVSKHCVSVEEYNKTNIVDINVPTSKSKDFITELAKDDSIENIFHDISGVVDAGKIKRLAKEPCIHVEIKQ